MKTHTYLPQKSKVLAKTALTDDVVALRLSRPIGFNFQPGQFVMLSVFGFGEVPIGITTAPEEKSYIEVAVRAVGNVTRKLCALEVGEAVGINGPFGNGFPLDKIKDKDLVLIAGGVGLAPLRSLIRHISLKPRLVKSLTILNGAKNEGQLLYKDEFEKWRKFSELFLTVDKCGTGWSECVGMITKLYDKVKINRGSVIISCGPPVMFKSVIDRYAAKSVAEEDLYFLLERRMKCGVGKCQHCTCGDKYVCLDGPLFSYRELKYNPEAFK